MHGILALICGCYLVARCLQEIRAIHRVRASVIAALLIAAITVSVLILDLSILGARLLELSRVA
jgi:hypothetical protein